MTTAQETAKGSLIAYDTAFGYAKKVGKQADVFFAIRSLSQDQREALADCPEKIDPELRAFIKMAAVPPRAVISDVDDPFQLGLGAVR